MMACAVVVPPVMSLWGSLITGMYGCACLGRSGCLCVEKSRVCGRRSVLGASAVWMWRYELRRVLWAWSCSGVLFILGRRVHDGQPQALPSQIDLVGDAARGPGTGGVLL